MNYRNATQEDLPEIVAIYNTTIAGRMVTADTEPVTVESRQHWFDIHSPEKRPLWMVEDEGVSVGWVSFQSFYGRPAYDGTAEISIYLHENTRGKGYGKKILKYAMEQCPSIKVHTLLGFIFAHNIPSLKLFEQLGFNEWAHLPNIAILDGVERSLNILGKRIY
ncbi:phosphinothricin acetyltransferase [Chitinophaga sp. YR627]|uniref:GNAT family N-acetyltransferase n=1 Tax=Chitinophaga sp. YR627 TaxID=1881041 RepID=UPI0008EB82AE|nr:GNAT family N-acetyltransferase [Chitinophaga sp. YR627]SFO72488.1 phosphinothricin acetyltransferase [Chitinophaga sp. YR627]